MSEPTTFTIAFNVGVLDVHKINRLTGCFYIDDLHISFMKMKYAYQCTHEHVKIEINNFGCMAKGYVHRKYIERLFGLDLNLFDLEYVIYAINKRSISHGVYFSNIPPDETLDVNNFMHCNIRKDEITFDALLDLDSILVDDFLIRSRPTRLKRNIPLNVSMKLFSQPIELAEIKSLSKEDVLIIK